jgi:hypothetical protein
MLYTREYDNFLEKYYWKEQIDFAYSQYSGLSEKEKKIWLDDKKQIFYSIKRYVRQREFLKYMEKRKKRSITINPVYSTHFMYRPRRRVNREVKNGEIEKVEKVNNDMPQLIQLQSNFKVNSANNYLENSNEQKKNNFIKTEKKKDKRESNNGFNKFNMKVKGKNYKNKFAHKYG